MEGGTVKPKVALVYPPFAPAFIPSLGLGLLSAGVKALGFECRTFFWGLDLVSEIPQASVDDRLAAYKFLAGNGSFPINEWIFGGEVFPEYTETAGLLERYMRNLEFRASRSAASSSRSIWWRSFRKRFPRRRPMDLRPSDVVRDLRRGAGGYVARMASQLDDFDIIGIGTTFFQNLAALALAKELKQRWPDKIVVFGGANCEGAMGKAQLELFPFVDYVFSGEVDFSFPDFVMRQSRKAPVTDLPGIIYRDETGKVVEGPTAEPLQDLDRLPLPDFSDFVATREHADFLKKWDLVVAVESARGCWWGAKQHCTFCGLNALGMGFRQKSQERFQWEIEEMKRSYGARHFYITDNILSMSYFTEFMDWAKRSETELNFFWEIKSNINRAQATRLAEAGVNWVQPGIESFSSDVLQIMRKGVRGIQNAAFLKYAAENGLLVIYYILYGFPGEQAETYYEMESDLRKLVHLEPPRAVVSIHYDRFNPYYENQESFGIRLKPASQYRLVYPFSDEVISRLAYYFERDDSPKFPYAAGLRKEVRRWQVAYERATIRNAGSALSWEAAADEILIDDCRPGFQNRRYRLRNHAVPVFHAMDAPTTLKAVMRSIEAARPSAHGSNDGDRGGGPEAKRPNGGSERAHAGSTGSGLWRAFGRREEVISFTREEFNSRPTDCLQSLVANGVLYVEGDWYLALPVAKGSRQAQSTTRRWRSTTLAGGIQNTPWYV
jgi:ribosomal peptide maturation radical SAM protein 1